MGLVSTSFGPGRGIASTGRGRGAHCCAQPAPSARFRQGDRHLGQDRCPRAGPFRRGRAARGAPPAVGTSPGSDALMTRRRQLAARHTSELNRLSSSPGCVHPDIEAHLRWLEQHVERTDKELRSLIENSPLWRAKDDLMLNRWGIGPATSATLIAARPELDTLNNRQARRPRTAQSRQRHDAWSTTHSGRARRRAHREPHGTLPHPAGTARLARCVDPAAAPPSPSLPRGAGAPCAAARRGHRLRG